MSKHVIAPQIPFNTDAEMLVLSSMMLAPRYADAAAEQLNPDMFEQGTPRAKIAGLFWAMLDCGLPITLSSVRAFARRTMTADEIAPLILALSNHDAGFDTDTLNMSIATVRQIWVRQRLAVLLTAQLKALVDDDFDIYDAAEMQKDEILSGRRSTVVEGREVLEEFEEKTLDAKARYDAGGSDIVGLETSLWGIDQFLLGVENGDMVVIAARPSEGKTALATQIMGNLAKNGVPVGFISLEMTNDALARRMTAQQTTISQVAFKSGGLNESEMVLWGAMSERMKAWPMYFDDKATRWNDLKQSATRMVKNNGCKALFIDYLQLIDGGHKIGTPANQSVGDISKWVKGLAKKLNVPIFILSQLSRDIQGRPKLKNLRDSGQIEQDADAVIFFFRPEYHGETEDADGNSTAGVAIPIIAKCRNGATGDGELKFDGPTNKISDVGLTPPKNEPLQTPF